MTRILRPVGQSYTVKDDAEHLARGVDPSDPAAEQITPDSLPGFLQSDDFQMMRQVISALDKVYRKPTRLRRYDAKAYARRVALARELWRLLEPRFTSAGADDRKRLRSLWKDRVFPFAEHKVNEAIPDNDDNYDALTKEFSGAKWPDGSAIKTEDFEGRWHNVDWLGDGQVLDPPRAAAAIMSHLFDQEFQIDNRPRRDGRKTGENRSDATGKGFIEARADSIVSSTSDPAGPTERSDKKKELLSAALANEEIMEAYFAEDFVGEIHNALTKNLARNERVFAAWFGDRMFEHFGVVAPKLPKQENGKLAEECWALHNAVRTYYKTLAKSEGFRRAIRWPELDGDDAERERQKLAHMLPQSATNLIERLQGKARNADMSAYIRLGKMVAHASDGFETWNFGGGDAQELSTFEDRLDFLATSEGQSRIKHLEAFARSWRRATALSLRSLQALANPDGAFEDEGGNSDVTTKPVAVAAYNGLNSSHYRNQVNLLFGADRVGEGGTTRASLFNPGGPDAEKEILWGLIAATTQVRAKTYHFNVRRAMLEMFEGSMLSEWTQGARNMDGRGMDRAAPEALKAFNELLAFDLRLQSRRVLDLFDRAAATGYLEKSRAPRLIEALTALPADVSVTPPRFRATIHKAQDLLKNEEAPERHALASLGAVELASDKVPEPSDKFRLEMLTEVYRSEFRSWLANHLEDRDTCMSALNAVVSDKTRRRSEYDREKKKFYTTPIKFLEDTGLDQFDTLQGLFQALQAKLMVERTSDRPYFKDKRAQQAATSRLEAFKQELFAHLFVRYLDRAELTWLTGDLPEPVENGRLSAEDFEQLLPESSIAFDEPWHAQIYTCFYLVPPADIAKLQHQMRKSRALAAKTHATPDEDVERKLTEIDDLMSLYIQVQATGFDGREHEPVIGDASFLYRSEDLFKQVFSTEYKDHQTTLSGTRRGLRQLARFAHLPVLKGVFTKHAVTEREVRDFVALHAREDANAGAVFTQREDLRKSIVADVETRRKRKPDDPEQFEKDLRAKCAQYTETAHQALGFRHRAEAGRLSDHLKLHRLMMNIIGRLTDYTAIWERDRLYAFLGMVARNQGPKDLVLEMQDLSRRQAGRRGLYVQVQIDGLDVPILSEEHGFAELKSKAALKSLTEEQKKAFDLAFGEIHEQNKLDQAAADRTIAYAGNDNVTVRSETHDFKWLPKEIVVWRRGKQTSRKWIRDDFAHQNALETPRMKRGQRVEGQNVFPNFNYLINSVRSLVSYDRKLKNAVPKSIQKLLAAEGLRVEWELKGDRLTNAQVYPDSETHLSFVGRAAGKEEKVDFVLPRASVRMTSMAQAMFTFSTGGNIVELDGGNDDYELAFPVVFFSRTGALRQRLNQATLVESATEKG